MPLYGHYMAPPIERGFRGGESIPFSKGLIHINVDEEILIQTITKKCTDFI